MIASILLACAELATSPYLPPMEPNAAFAITIPEEYVWRDQVQSARYRHLGPTPTTRQPIRGSLIRAQLASLPQRDQSVRFPVRVIGATFLDTIDLSDLEISDTLYFTDCNFAFGLRVHRAQLSSIKFTNCRFSSHTQMNRHRPAVDIDSVQLADNLSFTSCAFVGDIYLNNVSSPGGLRMHACELYSETFTDTRNLLQIASCAFSASVALSNFDIDGFDILLSDITTQRNLSLLQLRSSSSSSFSTNVQLVDCRIASRYTCHGINIDGAYDVYNTQCDLLSDYDIVSEPPSWPRAAERVNLAGLQYSRVEHPEPGNIQKRLDWLDTHVNYSEALYANLFASIENSGHPRSIRYVREQQRWQWHKNNGNPLLTYTAISFHHKVLGFGDRVHNLFGFYIVFFAIGVLIFRRSNVVPIQLVIERSDQDAATPETSCSPDSTTKCSSGESNPENSFTPDDEIDYPKFRPVAYSLDLLLPPVVKLQQVDYWIPRNSWHHIYMYVHIIAGWILSTILLLALIDLIMIN